LLDSKDYGGVEGDQCSYGWSCKRKQTTYTRCSQSRVWFPP